MLTIYHSKQSRSMRVVWLCEELGIDYAISPLAMFTPEMKTRDYLAIHPLGKVPAIDDDGFVLWETTAIFEHLATKHGGDSLVPPRGTREGALVSQWMAYGENPLTIIMGEIAAHGGPMPDEMRIPALVDPLIPLLEDKAWQVQTAAVKAAGALRTPDAIDAQPQNPKTPFIQGSC